MGLAEPELLIAGAWMAGLAGTTAVLDLATVRSIGRETPVHEPPARSFA